MRSSVPGRRIDILWETLQRVVWKGVLLAGVLGLIIPGCHSVPLRNSYDNRPLSSITPQSLILQDDLDIVPPVDLPQIPLPPVAGTPELNETWPLSLREAVNIALRNSEILRTLDGEDVISSGVTTFDPGVVEASREAAVAAFDATLKVGYSGNQYHQPPSTFFGPGIPANARRDDGTLTASLVKPWMTGGSASVAYNPMTGYLFFPDGTSGIFNPKHTATFEISARQPLLKGAGLEVNRAPIRVAQLRADQSVWDVKQATLALVRSVEEAYWNLQAAQAALRAIDDVLPYIDDVVHIQEERLKEERTIRAELAKARAQQATFRQQRINARSEALKQELLLRNLMGLPPENGLTIVPSLQPTRAPLAADPAATMRIAADNRPILMSQRLRIRIREMELLVAENGLKPQLDLQALYRTNGLSDNVGESLSMALKNQYTDWSAGANFSVPLGRRAGRANLHAAELILSRERLLLRQELHATAHRLGDLFRQLDAAQNEFGQAEIRVRETQEWLKGARSRYEDPPPGADGQDWLLLALNDYLQAIRSAADANTEVALILARYNTLLATLEEEQGILLASYDIQLDGDPIQSARATSWKIEQELIEPSVWDLREGE